jgi:hypothetical protein
MTRLARVLNEAVMGLLALVALATATAPLAFDLSPATEQLLNAVEIGILCVFVVEVAVQFAVARDRRAWLTSPLRIVDFLSIVGPAISFLPRASETMRGALAFRLLRVGRAVAFGARAGAAATQGHHEIVDVVTNAAPEVTVVTADAPDAPRPATWEELLAAAPRDGAWHHAENVAGGRFRDVAVSIGIPEDAQRGFEELDAGTYLRALAGGTTLFTWLPTVAEQGFPAVHRNRLVLHVSSGGAVTTTAQPFDLSAAVDLRQADGDAFALAVAHGVLGVLRDRYKFIAVRYEDEIRRLEELRVTGRGPVFLGHAFRLQREVSSASADLWRLKRVVQRLAEGKVPLGGVDVREDRGLDNLAGELEDADREFGTLKENLKSLLELHMNVTSFEMNKFMKLLAIVGFLGLIPSVAGGLLGMNVAGNPWPVTLGQVAFVVMMAMALSLYVFAVKGWLR